MFRFTVTVLMLLACWLASGFPRSEASEPIKIFVSIFPQKYLVERIGGERVTVTVMVRPGFSPETYEPTPKQMAALHHAKIYFRIGVPFETAWIDRIGQLNPRLNIIDCCQNLIRPKSEDHIHPTDNETLGHNLDNHVWTSPVNAQLLAHQINDTLSVIDPAGTTYYENNHNHLIDDLNELDQFIHEKLAFLPNRYLFVSHPSWEYFADRYNLKQVSIEQKGSEIRAKELARLIELGTRENIKSVYVQRQFNDASARILASAIDANVIELDPLAEDYINNLRHVTEVIAQGH